MKMTKFVECRVIDSEHLAPTSRPRRAEQVAAVTRRKRSEKAAVPKFVADLYARLDPARPELNAIA
jgi:hypothetical protein